MTIHNNTTQVMKSIAILCRGESLRSIQKLPRSDTTILVNSFGKEIRTNPFLREYIENTVIFLCANGSPIALESLYEINFFERYKPVKMIRPYLEEIAKTHVNLRNKAPLPDEFLDSIHKSYMFKKPNFRYPYTYPSSGRAAVGYAVLETVATEINIIGLDFYENSDYITGEKAIPDWGAKGPMQEVLTKLVRNHPNKQFTMVSTAESFLDEIKTLSNINLITVNR